MTTMRKRKVVVGWEDMLRGSGGGGGLWRVSDFDEVRLGKVPPRDGREGTKPSSGRSEHIRQTNQMIPI